MGRDKVIVRTSVIGIIANIFLAAFKAVVGILSHSIAITLDAVNNLSDALSSVITIVGTKLAVKPADKAHPYGHGRVEFISSFVISVIVLYAGVTSLIESIKKIINPEQPDYSAAALIIVTVAILVKVILGIHVKKTGEHVNSDSLIDSGKDALLDSIISLTTLIAAGIYIFFGFSTEPYLGAIISLVIIKSGYDMISESISRILGERVDSELAKEIKQVVCETEDVRGAYDLVLHSYGPERYIGSIHVEVDDTLKAARIDEITRQITRRVYERFGILMEAVGIYSINTTDEFAREAMNYTLKLLDSYPEVLQMHGFYLNQETHTITFDMVIDFSAENPDAIYKEIFEKVQARYPAYTLHIAKDIDISVSE